MIGNKIPFLFEQPGPLTLKKIFFLLFQEV